jgi:hypothetical protein
VGYRYSKYDASLTQATTLKAATISENTVTGDTNSRYQNSPTANTSTYSLNWILNSNARVMFNYSQTKFGSAVEYLDTDANTSTTKKEDIFSVRTQINF